MGLDNIMTMTEEQCKFIYDAARTPPEGTLPSPLPAGGAVADKRWRVGGLQFEALMRMLDNAVCPLINNYNNYLTKLLRSTKTSLTITDLDQNRLTNNVFYLKLDFKNDFFVLFSSILVFN